MSGLATGTATPAPVVGGGPADLGADMAIPIPNLSLSSGPSGADASGSVSGNTSGTGPFNFKGSSSQNSAWTQWIIPLVIGGAALWLITKK